MVMYYRFIYWRDACRTIICVFLIIWDPSTLSFLRLYHLRSPLPFENKSVVKEPCIWGFWNVIPLFQHSLGLWFSDAVSDPYLRKLAVFPVLLGPAASLSSRFRSTVHIAEPVWTVLSATSPLQRARCTACLMCWEFLAELEGFKRKLSCFQIRYVSGYSASLEFGPYLGRM